MKAILKFNLDEPEDRIGHLRAVKSSDLYLALWDITHNTRKQIEWQLDANELDKYEALELVYKRIYEILDTHNINIDELT
jgi:hypothetical protein